MDPVAEAVSALEAGRVVVLPTDTVYGLAASPHLERAVQEIFRLKQRPETSPIALVATDVDTLLECVPELRGRAATVARDARPRHTLPLPVPDRCIGIHQPQCQRENWHKAEVFDPFHKLAEQRAVDGVRHYRRGRQARCRQQDQDPGADRH